MYREYIFNYICIYNLFYQGLYIKYFWLPSQIYVNLIEIIYVVVPTFETLYHKTSLPFYTFSINVGYI